MIYIKNNSDLKNLFDILDEIIEPIITNNTTKCPLHDVHENENEYIFEFLLAGVKKEDINVSVEKDVLIVKAERKTEKDLKYLRNETFKGKYEKRYVLPENVDTNNIQAEFIDGVLKLKISKTNNEKSSKKTIEIK